MNRGKSISFRVETILSNNDIKKKSSVNLIIRLDRRYKNRNCPNNATFTLLIMNRGTIN